MFGKINVSSKKPEGQYVWKKSRKWESVDLGEELTGDNGYIITSGYQANSYTIQYSDEVELVDGEVALASPDSVALSYNGGVAPAEVLRGKYVVTYRQNASSQLLFIPENTVFSTVYANCGIKALPSYEVLDISEKEEFIDYVVSSDAEAFPDGGEQDGYWYELVVSPEKKIAEYGIFFNEFDADGYPLDVKMKAETFKSNSFYDSVNNTVYYNNLTKIEIEADTLENQALRYFLYNGNANVKAKVRSKSVGYEAFAYWGKSGGRTVDYWLSNDCETLVTNNKYGPFGANSSSNKIYCEAEAKPNGWGTNWEYYSQYTTLTVTWGVSEADFDAL